MRILRRIREHAFESVVASGWFPEIIGGVCTASALPEQREWFCLRRSEKKSAPHEAGLIRRCPRCSLVVFFRALQRC